MREPRHPVTVRIDSFLSDPNAGMLRGERRMGTELLMDMLADRIAEDGSANVIRIKGKGEGLDHIKSEIVAGKKNHILLYFDMNLKESNLIITTFPDAQLYRVKELCHQVPVCFKEPTSDYKNMIYCTESS